MIVAKEFPGVTFKTQDELFKALRENAGKIIALKKAEIYKSHEKLDDNTPGFQFLVKTEADAEKAGFQMKEGYVYPIINTTNYRDSHKDVHFPGIWNKSAKEQNGKLFYVFDHKTEVGKVIAWPEDVNVMVKSVPWSFVGKDYEGNTEALIYEIKKEKIVNELALKIIEEKRKVQNSVRMMYLKIQLGMNSQAKEDKVYKAYYDARITEIANKDEVEQDGYFWGVEEAKIVTEGSMVLRGSNDATPIKEQGAVEDTPIKIEPEISTRKTIINPNLF